jgi:predicted DNA-binding transcriptional regulator YafY
VQLDQRFSLPPKLTQDEAMALVAAAQMLGLQKEPSLNETLEKLVKVFPKEARRSLETMSRQVDLSTDLNASLRACIEAIDSQIALSFDYVALTTDESTKRTVSPLEVIHRHGYWYVSGQCHERQARRLFRIDLATHLKKSNEAFQVLGQSKTQSGPVKNRRSRVEVCFSGPLAQVMKERFPIHKKLGAQKIVVEIEADSPKWIAQWILGFGGEATVLKPAWAVRAVRRAVEMM